MSAASTAVKGGSKSGNNSLALGPPPSERQKASGGNQKSSPEASNPSAPASGGSRKKQGQPRQTDGSAAAAAEVVGSGGGSGGRRRLPFRQQPRFVFRQTIREPFPRRRRGSATGDQQSASASKDASASGDHPAVNGSAEADEGGAQQNGGGQANDEVRVKKRTLVTVVRRIPTAGAAAAMKGTADGEKGPQGDDEIDQQATTSAEEGADGVENGETEAEPRKRESNTQLWIFLYDTAKSGEQQHASKEEHNVTSSGEDAGGKEGLDSSASSYKGASTRPPPLTFPVELCESFSKHIYTARLPSTTSTTAEEDGEDEDAGGASDDDLNASSRRFRFAPEKFDLTKLTALRIVCKGVNRELIVQPLAPASDDECDGEARLLLKSQPIKAKKPTEDSGEAAGAESSRLHISQSVSSLEIKATLLGPLANQMHKIAMRFRGVAKCPRLRSLPCSFAAGKIFFNPYDTQKGSHLFIDQVSNWNRSRVAVPMEAVVEFHDRLADFISYMGLEDDAEGEKRRRSAGMRQRRYPSGNAASDGASDASIDGDSEDDSEDGINGQHDDHLTSVSVPKSKFNADFAPFRNKRRFGPNRMGNRPPPRMGDRRFVLMPARQVRSGGWYPRGGEVGVRFNGGGGGRQYRIPMNYVVAPSPIRGPRRVGGPRGAAVAMDNQAVIVDENNVVIGSGRKPRGQRDRRRTGKRNAAAARSDDAAANSTEYVEEHAAGGEYYVEEGYYQGGDAPPPGGFSKSGRSSMRRQKRANNNNQQQQQIQQEQGHQGPAQEREVLNHNNQAAAGDNYAGGPNPRRRRGGNRYRGGRPANDYADHE